MTFYIGLFAGLVNLAALGVYAHKAFTNPEKKPNRAGWLIWTVESFLLLSSYYYSTQNHESIWVPLGDVIGISTVFIISIWHGEGGWEPLDRWCLGGALVTIPFWIITHSALAALILNLIIDFLGALPTAKKAYLDPGSEDKLPWALFLMGNSINLIPAICQGTLAEMLYPSGMVIISLTIALPLFLRKAITR